MKWVGIFPIDINLLRNNPEVFREAFRKRYLDERIVDKALELDSRWREIKRKVDEHRAKVNRLTKLYYLLKSGKELDEKSKLVYNEYKDEIEKEGLDFIKKLVNKEQEEIKQLEMELEKVEKELIKILYTFPNFVDEDVPIGPDENYNVPIKFWGIPRVWKNYVEQFKRQLGEFKGVRIEELDKKYILDEEKLKILVDGLIGREELKDINFDSVLDFELLNKDKIVPYVEIDWKPKHHYDLTEEYGLADTEIAAIISGSRFYIEKEPLVFLDFALSLYGLRFYKEAGYDNIIIPPYLMKREVEEKITYYEAFKEAIYEIKDEDLILITTSEHPIVAIYMNKTFDEKDLPIRVLAWSPAFRKEAGSHGKDTKGIFRTHQFHKVELHVISTIEDDRKYLEELLDVFENFMRSLNLPYRIVKLSSGDMDKRATVQYDLEAWFPGQGKYRELGSLATMRDWVSRKVNIRVRRKGKIEYVANLYSTGCAVQRTICSIIENFYDKKTDSIVVPRVLRDLAGFSKIKKVI